MKFILSLLVLLIVGTSIVEGEDGKPNIVIILADDMGYGDCGVYNPESKIPTPHIDQLAKEGLRFTDAHSAATTCTPSRYGLLTGINPARKGVKNTLLKSGHPIIDEGRPTIATLLREKGYMTTMVGKWHLGFEMLAPKKNFDFSKPLVGGPMDCGFDYFHGIKASPSASPYFYIKGRHPVVKPTETTPGTHGAGKDRRTTWGKGDIAPGFVQEEVAPKFCRDAVRIIREHAASNERRPLFLYYALTSPHSPWVPTKEFIGKSGAGLYGDFIMQLDDEVGQVHAALKETGLDKNTILIFTSDNGPMWMDRDVEKFSHRAVGMLRGHKASPYEGGHRVPFIVKWPGRIQPSTVTATTINFTDVFATLAELLNAEKPASAEDSHSFLPALFNPSKRFARPAMVNTSSSIRMDDWKLVTPKKGKKSHTELKLSDFELYNLADDVGEKNDLSRTKPELAGELYQAYNRFMDRRTLKPGAPDSKKKEPKQRRPRQKKQSREKRPAKKEKSTDKRATTGGQSTMKPDMFAKMDKNQDGQVAREEFIGVFASGFDRKDKNNDGLLTPDEQLLKGPFKNADADNDGKLTREEYLGIFERQFDRNHDINKDGVLSDDDSLANAAPAKTDPKPPAQKPVIDYPLEKETFKPYQTAAEVPQTVEALWRDYDARKEPLDVEVVKTWDEEDLVCKYVIFTIGTFKGVPSRIAAYYTYPKGVKKAPGIVWAHGGGQRADRERGYHLATKGYAMVDINWNGRELEKGIAENTDWGKIDPTQGPKFYPKALRKNFHADLTPDEHTIDPIDSPRNSSWYLLSLIGRRAITFLEQQPEVDPDRIGFTGYSMGGNITSMTAIDPRLKAAIPAVGGTGFIGEDWLGYPNSARKHNPQEMFDTTIDMAAYMPLIKCPVLFLSGSDDFHAGFDRITKAVDLLPHDNWMVSQALHNNHQPNAKQWLAFEYWFDHWLKGEPAVIPPRPRSSLKPIEGGKKVRFSVTPSNAKRLTGVNIYYSHDSQFKLRFWKFAPSKTNGKTWTTDIEVRQGLPLYVFADCTYKSRSGGVEETLRGPTDTFSIISKEHIRLPGKLDMTQLHARRTFDPVLEDFKNGLKDWGMTRDGGIVTYKFNDPDLEFPQDKKLAIQLDLPEGNFSVRIRINSTNKADRSRNRGSFGLNENIMGPGLKEVVLSLGDFKNGKAKGKDKVVSLEDWHNISTFSIGLYDITNKQTINLYDPSNAHYLKQIHWVD